MIIMQCLTDASMPEIKYRGWGVVALKALRYSVTHLFAADIAKCDAAAYTCTLTYNLFIVPLESQTQPYVCATLRSNPGYLNSTFTLLTLHFVQRYEVIPVTSTPHSHFFHLYYQAHMQTFHSHSVWLTTVGSNLLLHLLQQIDLFHGSLSLPLQHTSPTVRVQEPVSLLSQDTTLN